ncbi:MAG: hypothetical protein JWM02_3586 [Frankiales bacterium]|nr:hypothetical protein [Frankiales bacterium]
MIYDSPVIRKALFAALLGVLLLPIARELFEHSGAMTVWVGEMSLRLGARADMPSIVRTTNGVFWTILIGALFGIPLGVAVRHHVFRYWLVFVAAALAVELMMAVLSPPLGVHFFRAALMLSEHCLYLMSVFFFASLACVRRDR